MSRILKLARTFNGLTQGDMARELGVAQSYISEVEAGKRPVSLQTIRRYAKVLDVPPSSLLFFMEQFDGEEQYVPAESGFLKDKALDLLAWLQEKAQLAETE